MKATGRVQGRTAPKTGNKEAFLATHTGDEIERQARVEHLRHLVASGRYKVDSDDLANEILRRALCKSR